MVALQSTTKDTVGGYQEKKKKKNTKELHVAPTRAEVDDGNKHKKKRKRDNQKDTGDSDTPTPPQKRLGKAQEVQPEEQAVPVKDSQQNRKRKKKKRKTSSGPNYDLLSEAVNKKHQKKRKNKTGFPDPDEGGEGNLSDQARKALSYAFTQFHEPNAWKFSKAKQNWLVRNFWNLEAIPAKYDGLVIKYLSAVQGNTRTNLIKTCQIVVDSAQTRISEGTGLRGSSTSAGLGGTLIDAASSLVPQKEDTKTIRAQALLQALAPLESNIC